MSHPKHSAGGAQRSAVLGNQDRLSLTFYFNNNSSVVEAFHATGHTGSLHPWQVSLTCPPAHNTLAITIFDHWGCMHACMHATRWVLKQHDAQAEALAQEGVLEGRSLVISAPTCAGKGAVADVLALRRLCDPRTAGQVVLLVLPFVSWCQDRVAHLEQLLKPLGKCVTTFLSSPHSCHHTAVTGRCTVGRWWACTAM